MCELKWKLHVKHQDKIIKVDTVEHNSQNTKSCFASLCMTTFILAEYFNFIKWYPFLIYFVKKSQCMFLPGWFKLWFKLQWFKPLMDGRNLPTLLISSAVFNHGFSDRRITYGFQASEIKMWKICHCQTAGTENYQHLLCDAQCMLLTSSVQQCTEIFSQIIWLMVFFQALQGFEISWMHLHCIKYFSDFSVWGKTSDAHKILPIHSVLGHL